MAEIGIGSIVWGVLDINRAVDFWVQALHYKVRYQSDDWAILLPLEGNGVQLSLNLMSSEKPRRHHMDLFCSDREKEMKRLLDLGAVLKPWHYPEDADYVVLVDPEGNSFCLVQK